MVVNGRSIIAVVLLALGSSAAMMPDNDTRSIVRTFSGFFMTITDEPIEYLDVQEGSGSGAESQREVRPQVSKGRYYVSKDAAAFLKGHVSTIFIPTAYVLVFVTSVPLNLLALVTFSHRVRPKKPAAIYMMNLACADLLFSLVLPFRIAYHFSGNDWRFGDGFCRLVTAAFYCNMYCSVLLVTAISVDRLLAVAYPTDSLMYRTPRSAWAACTTSWLLSSAGVLPLLLSQQTMHISDLSITTCHDVLDVRTLRSYYVYFFPVYSALFFFVPFLVSTVCYFRIIRVLRAVGDHAKRNRALLMAITVFVVFAACFTPANIILMMHSVQAAKGIVHGDSSYIAYLLAMCAGSTSCSLDPLLYYFGSSRCHKAALDFLSGRSRRSRMGETEKTQSTTSSKLDTFKSNASSQYSKLMA